MPGLLRSQNPVRPCSLAQSVTRCDMAGLVFLVNIWMCPINAVLPRGIGKLSNGFLARSFLRRIVFQIAYAPVAIKRAAKSEGSRLMGFILLLLVVVCCLLVVGCCWWSSSLVCELDSFVRRSSPERFFGSGTASKSTQKSGIPKLLSVPNQDHRSVVVTRGLPGSCGRQKQSNPDNMTSDIVTGGQKTTTYVTVL